MEDELKAKWPPVGRSTWGVCGICGHDAVVSGLGLDMDVSSDWGARKAATGGRQEHYK